MLATAAVFAIACSGAVKHDVTGINACGPRYVR
jgi:hypothetical protein